MPKYIVVHTMLRHGREGAKTAKDYLPGSEIELTDEEAAALGDNAERITQSAKRKAPSAK